MKRLVRGHFFLYPYRQVVTRQICIFLLLHKNNQVLASAPEDLWIGDAQCILLVGITYQAITAGWMSCEQLSCLRIQLDLGSIANIDLGEVVLIEVTIHHLTVFHDVLTLQLLLGTEYIPSGVQLDRKSVV